VFLDSKIDRGRSRSSRVIGPPAFTTADDLAHGHVEGRPASPSPHMWNGPLRKGLFCFLNLRTVRAYVRPVERTKPLAMMISATQIT